MPEVVANACIFSDAGSMLAGSIKDASLYLV